MIIDLVALEARLAPVIKQLLASPEVKQDIAMVTEAVTSYVLEIIQDEVKPVCSDQGFGRYVRTGISKIKELFCMFKNKVNLHRAADDGAGSGSATGSMSLGPSAATAATAAPAPVTWSATISQGELQVLGAIYQTAVLHENWPLVRNNLEAGIAGLLVNYGFNKAVAALTGNK
ncbi:MAG: hypothetical protein P4N59_10700 [Negativicutes bacterium]|nr:hypothetical protein [Negativicutes bacterium]